MPYLYSPCLQVSLATVILVPPQFYMYILCIFINKMLIIAVADYPVGKGLLMRCRPFDALLWRVPMILIS